MDEKEKYIEEEKRYTSKIFNTFLKRHALPLIAINNTDIDKMEVYIIKKNSIHFPELKISDNSIVIQVDKEYQCVIKGINISKDGFYNQMFQDVIINFIELIDPYKFLIPNNYYLPVKTTRSNNNLGFEELRSDIYENIYKLAVQKSICQYISNTNENARKVEKLIYILESWSMKTYEGHKVCYGIVIDPAKDNTNDDEVDFTSNIFEFLEEEFSAVISDGFSSVLLLNSECRFIGYESITGPKARAGIKVNHFLPFRFHDIIYNHTQNDRVGLFLLQNGDIIIAKNMEISFIKRNNKWLNFDRYAFINAIKDTYSYNNDKKYYSDKLFPSIYSTMLDVSLSHTGGIIAVVDEKNLNEKNKDHKILNEIDYMKNEIKEGASNSLYLELYKKEFLNIYNDYDGIDKNPEWINTLNTASSKNEIDIKFNEINNVQIKNINNDIVKRLTKRKYIIKLLNKKRKFNRIDKKMLAELIGLDGAFIMNTKGEILSFGAIIQNNAGSSGGGRGAAAKKLSGFGGFAIKISTDGYIEVYANEKRIYSIK